MNTWRTTLVYALTVSAPTLTACMAGGVVVGGVAGREVTHSTVGTTGGAAAGVVIGHGLSR